MCIKSFLYTWVFLALIRDLKLQPQLYTNSSSEALWCERADGVSVNVCDLKPFRFGLGCLKLSWVLLKVCGFKKWEYSYLSIILSRFVVFFPEVITLLTSDAHISAVASVSHLPRICPELYLLSLFAHSLPVLPLLYLHLSALSLFLLSWLNTLYCVPVSVLQKRPSACTMCLFHP